MPDQPQDVDCNCEGPCTGAHEPVKKTAAQVLAELLKQKQQANAPKGKGKANQQLQQSKGHAPPPAKKTTKRAARSR